MRRPKTVVFGLITTLGLLALLEGGSRLVRHVEYPPDPLMTREAPRWPERRQYDSLLFWTLRPNPEDPRWLTNSLGLRAPEIPPKPSDEFRILSLGESSTHGQGTQIGRAHV